ncbi:hypothetical protein BH20CHL3_BH20CHL3_03580 [soil metagenome]
MSLEAGNRHCTWCGESIVGGSRFCPSCGKSAIDTDNESTETNEPESKIGRTVLVAIIVSVAVYATFSLWPDDDSPNPGFVPSALAPCAGWSEWESRWPDTSAVFPIHWAIQDGEQLSKDEYRDWLNLVRYIRDDMEDAGPSPYVLQEYQTKAKQWIEVLDRMVHDLFSDGEVDFTLDFNLLEYTSNQMGIEWGNAILECPPSARG